MADLFTTPNVGAVAAAAAAGGLNPDAAASPAQLKALAAQFEALLMGQLLREMQQSMFEEDGGESSGMSSGPLADTLFAEVSLALSRSGGLGLGTSLIEPLTRQAGVADAASAATAPLAATSLAGASLAQPADADAAASMPGRLTSGYGWRRDPIDGQMRFHRGLDLAMRIGEDVPAARTGEVEFAGEQPGYGLTVVVKHDARTSTRYAHLSEILVRTGDAVEAGATIARSGASGRATGPHLHVEVLEDGRPVEPSAIKVRRRVAD
ncbi:MAG: peptidoglycan DD-metalloendopeptidase family protein [Acidobacteria bacterium]|nr:peptidoglycan DD-metalloendopeptidase family protein [Acidobacteriota bacterium]